MVRPETNSQNIQLLTSQEHTLKISAKMLSGSQVIQLFVSKFHPNCQFANRLSWQKQVKFQINLTFEVVKILSLNFQDFFKSLNSLRANFEEIWRWCGVDLPKNCCFDMEWPFSKLKTAFCEYWTSIGTGAMTIYS